MDDTGIEPGTSRMLSECDNQLHQTPFFEMDFRDIIWNDLLYHCNNVTNGLSLFSVVTDYPCISIAFTFIIFAFIDSILVWVVILTV